MTKDPTQHRARGFSLVELLTVVAIIGVLSLISVPAFMNYQRSSQFKAALRNFTHDLRSARQMAISQAFEVRLEFQEGTTTSKRYRFWSSRDRGTTWDELTFSGTTDNWKQLEGPVYIDSSTGLPDVDSNSMPDIVFHPNGTVDFAGGATTANVRLRTEGTNVAINRYTITLTPSGQLKSAGDKV